MAKYVASFLAALYLVFSQAEALAVNPAELIKLKNAGVSDKVIIAVIESDAIPRAIISIDQIIEMKSVKMADEIILKIIENGNRPVSELDRQDTKDFALKRGTKRSEIEMDIQKKELEIIREHLSKLITNPEILKLVKAGKISSKDYADITKYLKQYARDEDSIDYSKGVFLDADINIKKTVDYSDEKPLDTEINIIKTVE
ncbi:MAG: hypothetical protein QME06_03345 [Desulfobacterales bacterium]|nr:hypothetical protein [Desulfobacterales bacterium]